MSPWKVFITRTLSFICILSLSALIWIVTLQTTLLKREVAKSWLRDSGLYNHLVTNMFEAPPGQEQTDTPVSTTLVHQALAKIFPPDYVQQHSEYAIDSLYDWLEGKTPQPKFSVPIDHKRTAFIEELALAIKPHVADLPLCDATALAAERFCRPPHTPADEYAKIVADDLTAREELLAEPITGQRLAAKQPLDNLQALNSLPATVWWLHRLLMVLLVIVIVSMGLIALVATDRLRAFMALFKRIFIGAVLTLAGAGVLWYLSTHTGMLSSLSSMQSSLTSMLVPVLQNIIGGIAGQLAAVSGLAASASGAAWLCLFSIRRRQAARYRPSMSDTTPPHKT